MGTPATLSSVPAVTPYIQYVATSNQTVFPYPFPITQDSDLIVVINGVTQATDSGYTLTGQGNPTGGNLTFTLGQTTGTIVTLFRDITIQRVTQIAQNSGFSSTAFNAEFNNLYLIAQQLQESIGFSLQLPNTNNPAPTTTLTPAAYANKYLSFDANGNPIPAVLTSSGSLTAAIIAGLINVVTSIPLLASLFQSPGEIANGITPTNYSWPRGDARRYGFSPDNGVTDNSTIIQNAFTANAGYDTVRIPAGGAGAYAKVAGRITAPANLHVVMEPGAELRWASTSATGTSFLGTASRPGIEVLGDNVIIEGRGKLTGPATVAAGSGAGGGGVTAFVQNEFCIFRKGTSAAARGTGLSIKDVEISLWGHGGIITQFMQDIQVQDCIIHDIGYAGNYHLSAQNCKEYRNKVYGIAPGSAGNAYGISHGHDSTNYNTDPLVGATITAISLTNPAVVTINTVSGSNPFQVGMSVGFASCGGTTQINGLFGTVSAIGGVSGAWTFTLGGLNGVGVINASGFGAYTSGGLASCPQQATNPYCIDMDCAFNEVRDIPLWTALDAHGCYGGHYHHNKVYNCLRGIQIATGSNAAVNYAGENNSIEDNLIDGRQINGNATTVATGYQAGIVVNGGSVVYHKGVLVARNKFDSLGHANAAPTVYVVEASYCQNAIIRDNTFKNCVGRCVYMNNSSAAIKDNEFGSVGSSSTGAYLLYIDSNCGPMSITGNKHQNLDGTLTAFPIGLTAPGSGYTRFTVLGNDFTACGTPFNSMGLLVRNMGDVTPLINDPTTGSHTIDVSVVGQAPRFMIQATQTSAATLTSLLNPQLAGQECVISMTGSNTLTVNNAGNIQLQGGTAALTNQSNLTLVWSAVNSKWEERSRALGNS